MLFQITRETRYAEAGMTANRFVRRTVRVDGPPDTRGGVKGSFPVDGEYAVRVRLRRNLYGYIRGIGRPRVVDMRVDGTRVARATVGGEAPGPPAPAFGWTGSAFQGSPEWEDYMLHADNGLEFRFQ